MVVAKDLMSRSYLAVTTNEAVSKLIGQMKNKHTSFALVFQNSKYKGLIDRRFLLTSRVDTSRMKVNNILKKRSKAKTQFFVPKLDSYTELNKICRLMATSNAHALPIVENNKVIGVVTANKLLGAIRKTYSGIKAKELVKRKIILAKENEQIGKIIERMHLKKIDKMPIIDNLGKLIGIVTVNDIMKYFHRWPMTSQRVRAKGSRTKAPNRDSGESQDRLKAPIRNLMTPARMCFTANLNTSISLIIDMMIKENIGSVILQENQKPKAIITVKDILEGYSKWR